MCMPKATFCFQGAHFVHRGITLLGMASGSPPGKLVSDGEEVAEMHSL